MKILRKTLVSALFVCLLGGWTACDSDEPSLDGNSTIFRSTDALKADFGASRKYITVRTKGSWQVEKGDNSEWISLSPENGVGDGERRDTVYLTLTRNKGAERIGSINLIGGGKTLPIQVTQAEGRMSWGTMAVSDALEQNVPISNVYLTLSYKKGYGSPILISVTPTGAGATGLQEVKDFSADLLEGEGILRVPLSGTPTSEGEVIFNVSLKEADGSLWGGPALSPASVATKIGSKLRILSMAFSDFPMWGYDYVHAVSYSRPTTSAANVSIHDTPTQATTELNDGHGSGLTSSIRAVNMAFIESIGMKEWTGSVNYLRPGYIRIGHQTNSGAYLISPKLVAIESGKSMKIVVNFKVCPHIGTYFPEKGMQVLLAEKYPTEASAGKSYSPWNATGIAAQAAAGTKFYDTKGNQVDITAAEFNNNVDNCILMTRDLKWQEKSVVFEKANANCQLIFCLNGNYATQGGVFFFLDDIEVKEF